MLLTLSSGFAPIVKAGEEQSAWEEFAYNYFDTRIQAGEFPNTTAINNFPPPDLSEGRGIWRMMKTEKGPIRIPDNDDITSSRGILTPIIQCCIDNPGDHILLFNLYSEKVRRETIDQVHQCAKQMKEDKGNEEKYPDETCFAMTPYVRIVRFNQVQPSSSIMFQPIYPADDPWEISGLICEYYGIFLLA